MPDDAELILRCAGGDAAALHELSRTYSGPLNGLLVRMLGSRDDAEDVLVDVYLRVWKSAARFQGRCSPRSWIYRIAISAATDLLRQRKRTATRLTELDTALETAAPRCEQPEQIYLMREEEDRNARLAREALDSLPAEERVAAVLYHLEDLSYQEIAQSTGVPVTTVRMRLFRARRRMNQYVRERLAAEEAAFTAQLPRAEALQEAAVRLGPHAPGNGS